MTKKSPVGAFHKFGKSLPFHLGGWINAVIPMMIVPYYSVIGGWVLKYLFEYIRGNANLVAQDGYFNSFITSSMEVEIWFLIFAALGIYCHSCRCKKWSRTCFKGYDAASDPAGSLCGCLFHHKTGSRGRHQIFPDPESGELFLDDGRCGDGADVLFPVDCDGYPVYVWILYREDVDIEKRPRRLRFLTPVSHFWPV